MAPLKLVLGVVLHGTTTVLKKSKNWFLTYDCGSQKFKDQF
jgi:hypothetical protein